MSLYFGEFSNLKKAVEFLFEIENDYGLEARIDVRFGRDRKVTADNWMDNGQKIIEIIVERPDSDNLDANYKTESEIMKIAESYGGTCLGT